MYAADDIKPGQKLMQGAVKLVLPNQLRAIQLVPGRLTLQQDEQQKVDMATRQLVNQNFSADIGRSLSVQPRVTIIAREGAKLRAEALVVFLAKDTYTARISRLEYEIEGDNTILKNRTDDFAPSVQTIKPSVSVSPAVQKLKKDMLIDLKITLPQGVGPKSLANTPCPEFQSAVDSTNAVNAIFGQAFGGLNTVLIGPASTKTAIMDILKNSTRLLAWNNIGHGNPSSIIQWNHEPIWNTDFNSTTTFSGVYNSVILLNSCNVCASPYSLKNAIKQHKPRTYIGGSISLPVGRSELVDVDFWRKSLLEGKAMGVALNEASAAHGLTGAFCLDGYNGTFATVEAAKFTEDCIPFNPNIVQAQKVGSNWKVVAGSMWMLDFGANQANAQKAVDIIKHYKMDKQCFVGRPDAPMMYFTTGGRSPQGAFPGEDAIPFNPLNISASKINGTWKVVDGSHYILDFGPKEAEARIAVDIIRFYGFNMICFVGRPNAPMTYFRK
jgi:hypothetical protein